MTESELPRHFGDPAEGAYWSADPPGDGEEDGVDADPVIRTLSIAPDDYGVFWDQEGHLSDDFEDLHRWLGLSRETYDAVMAWADDYICLRERPSPEWVREHVQRGEDLQRRLQAEVPAQVDVVVIQPTAETLVLMEMSVGPSGFLESRSLDPDSEAARALRRAPVELSQRVAAWVGTGRRHMTVEMEMPAYFAWQEEGAAIAREVAALLGPGYYVAG